SNEKIGELSTLNQENSKLNDDNLDKIKTLTRLLETVYQKPDSSLVTATGGTGNEKLINLGFESDESDKPDTATLKDIKSKLDSIKDKNFTEQIMSEIKKHTITDAIIKITYKLPIGAQDSVDIKKIQIFCANAWYIVGIFPIRTLEPKQHRTYLNTDMDLKTLLKKYFDDKPSTQKRSSELLEKTMNLVVQKEQDELQVPAE
ncbi:hypothetical protein EBR77_01745, partial [bacterium]|nr:hypothetical protein [bacterium]